MIHGRLDFNQKAGRKWKLSSGLITDGLPREHIQEVFQQVSDEVMSIVDVVVAGAFNVDTADFLPNEWTHSLATMISLLARLMIGHRMLLAT